MQQFIIFVVYTTNKSKKLIVYSETAENCFGADISDSNCEKWLPRNPNHGPDQKNVLPRNFQNLRPRKLVPTKISSHKQGRAFAVRYFLKLAATSTVYYQPMPLHPKHHLIGCILAKHHSCRGIKIIETRASRSIYMQNLHFDFTLVNLIFWNIYVLSAFKEPFKQYVTQLGEMWLAKEMTKCKIGGGFYAKEWCHSLKIYCF